MLFWKSKWKKEIDSVLPKLSYVDSERSVAVSKLPNKRRTFKYFLATAVAAVLVLTCVLSMSLFVPPVQSKKAIMVEINPSVVFVIDESDKVISVKPLNEDADVILTESSDFIGKDSKTALKTYLDKALELGYLSFESSAVRLSSDGWDNGVDAIKNEMQNFLLNKGARSAVIENKVSKEEFSSLLGVSLSEQSIVDSVANLPEYFIAETIDGLSKEDLQQKYKEYTSKAYLEEIKNYVADKLDVDTEFLDKFTGLKELLEKIFENIESNLIEQFSKLLNELPENEEEFILKLKTGSGYVAQLKKEKNESNYKEVRESLTLDDVKNLVWEKK